LPGCPRCGSFCKAFIFVSDSQHCDPSVWVVHLIRKRAGLFGALSPVGGIINEGGRGFAHGRFFDDRGNRMSPSHARKGGVKYRYYLSSALLQGVADSAGSVRRVPAADIETLLHR
jgi:hypothetical protein